MEFVINLCDLEPAIKALPTASLVTIDVEILNDGFGHDRLSLAVSDYSKPYGFVAFAPTYCDAVKDGSCVCRAKELLGVVRDAKKMRAKRLTFSARSDGKGRITVIVDFGGKASRAIAAEASEEPLRPPRWTDDDGHIAIPRETFLAAAKALASMDEPDGRTAGRSLVAIGDWLLCTDCYACAAIPLPGGLPAGVIAVPRIIVRRLAEAKDWTSALLAPGQIETDTRTMAAVWKIRDGIGDETERLAPIAERWTDRTKGRHGVEIEAGEFALCARQMKPFCRAGDTVKLLPHAEGLKFLRYDVTDTGHCNEIDLNAAPRAEAVCRAVWPLAAPVCVPLGQLEAAAGDCDCEICVPASDDAQDAFVLVRRVASGEIRFIAPVANCKFASRCEI